jgi:RNA polymerase sigma factor (sigma-70 family)
MPDISDMELVREFARNHSEAAFTELMRRHLNLVYSVARRCMGNDGDAHDVTQAVFIILARKAAGLRDKTLLAGWLYETTRFTAARLNRTNARRRAREQEAYMQSTLNEADQAAVWARLSPHLEAAMSRLAERDRALLVLRFYENKSGPEAAALLGISEDSAQKRAWRAIEKLRKFFARQGVALSGVAIAGAVAANSVQAAPVALAKTIPAVALAHGAAATTSTLTLVKGALKIMAWTKAKMAVFTSVVILLAAAGTVTVVENHLRHAPPHQTGRLKLPTGNVTPMIVCGYSHNGIILASDGSLWSWGEERFGWPVLGLTNTNIQKTVSLRRIGYDTDWRDVSAGDSHCLAVKADGTLWAWGGNNSYQLGDGTKISRPTPVPSIPGNDWKQAAAGAGISFAIKNDGTLWVWGGGNWSGEYGNGTTKGGPNVVQMGASTNWTKIWAGPTQVAGLQSDGSLWFWGTVAGDSDGKKILVPTRVSPDTNWMDVCFGYFTVLAIKADGTLWSWGNQARFYTENFDPSLNGTPLQVGKESGWQSCASEPACFYHILTKKDGSFWVLDASEHRQVKPDSQYKSLKPRRLDLQKDVLAFTAAGDDIGVILTRDGEVWTWGRAWGELSAKDYGPHGVPTHARLRTVAQPWQILNIDSYE